MNAPTFDQALNILGKRVPIMSNSVYEIVTDEIIKKLESGTVPWHQPWKSFGPPRNLISGKPYRGINFFLLSLSDFSSPFYLSFKQAQQCGGNVRKGQHGSIAVFWKEWTVEERNEATGKLEEKRIPLLRY